MNSQEQRLLTASLFIHDQNRACPKCGCHKFLARHPGICAFCGRQEDKLKDRNE